MRTFRVCLTGFLMGAYLAGTAVIHMLVNDEALHDIRRPR